MFPSAFFAPARRLAFSADVTSSKAVETTTTAHQQFLLASTSGAVVQLTEAWD